MNFAVLFVVCMGAVLTFKQTDYTVIHYYLKLVSSNSSVLKNLVVENVKPNRTFRAFSFRYELVTDIGGDTFKVEFQNYYLTNNEFRIGLMKFNVKICDMIKKNLFGSRFIFTHSNITDCPMTKGYYVGHNFNIIDECLPPHIPRGRWKLTFDLIYQSYSIALLEWYGAIVDKV